MKDTEDTCKETFGIWQTNILKEIYTLKYEEKIDKILIFDRLSIFLKKSEKSPKKPKACKTDSNIRS